MANNVPLDIDLFAKFALAAAAAPLLLLTGCSAPLPQTLRETGLYAGDTGEGLAEGVRSFAPRFALWSDAADKRRFIRLPEGETIDTSDLDFWVFPPGTKLWKEFERDGVRIETRLLEKLEDGTWAAAAYVWNDDGTSAQRAPSSGQQDAHGTPHDVPGEGECAYCHALSGEWPLGFSALQLAHDGDGVTLDDLVAESLLSDPPAEPISWPDEVTREAVGYLYANCGGCHHEKASANADRIPWWFEAPPAEMTLRIEVAELAGPLEDSALWRSTAGVSLERHYGGDGVRIQPGDAEGSGLIIRMSRRDEGQMPPIGTEVVDEEGVAVVSAWIDSLSE